MTALVLALLLLGSPADAPPTATSIPTSTPAAPAPPAAAHPERSDAASAAERSRGTTAAVSEKLAQGDRLIASGDLRGGVFTYLDAVYLQPGCAIARLKLGRAYLALRYPERAIEQAQQVLAVDPGSAEARKLIDDARSPAPRPPPTAAVISSATPAEPAPRTYRLAGADAGVLGGVAPPPAPRVAFDAPEPPAPPRAPELYRLAVDQIAHREFAAAIETLTDAIARDPRLGVAYSARASAEFGLQRYRDAADDYKVALGLAPDLATPLYGLGECYRLLGDPAAAEMYGRYSESRARDVREDLRVIAAKRAKELSGR